MSGFRHFRNVSNSDIGEFEPMKEHSHERNSDYDSQRTRTIESV
jgi:hypothetical protein